LDSVVSPLDMQSAEHPQGNKFGLEGEGGFEKGLGLPL
jgi:hypothetical protein